MIIIPADPLAIPSAERRDVAFDLLRALRPTADEIAVNVSETPEFIYSGGDFETVFCPFCAAAVGDWFGQALDIWWHGDRRALAVETPCCTRRTSLNDLDFLSPQGFACFAFELMNPWGDLEPEELAQVEKALGMSTRIVWRHI
jgi:hypothetical protein